MPITGYTSTPCTDADPYAAVVPASLSPGAARHHRHLPVVRRRHLDAHPSSAPTSSRTSRSGSPSTEPASCSSRAPPAWPSLRSPTAFGSASLLSSQRTTRPTRRSTPASTWRSTTSRTTQRGLWFAKLFSQKPSGSSPTREGLARVGRHYAGKHDGINEGMPEDPVQFACQQNFTIMTTDGYWNAQDESTAQGAFIGGPVDIGGQDAGRPAGRHPERYDDQQSVACTRGRLQRHAASDLGRRPSTASRTVTIEDRALLVRAVRHVLQHVDDDDQHRARRSC